MANLSPGQIYDYAYKAGFRGADLLMAVAIAVKESGGDTKAYNPELAAGTRKGSGSRGLWQIYGQAHPEYNNDLVYDPQANANAAYKVYQQAGNKFTPWSTFNNGSAASILPKLDLNRARNDNQVPTPETSYQNNTSNPLSFWEGVNNIFTSDTAKNAGKDFAAIGGGFILVGIGLVALFFIGGGDEKLAKVAAMAAKAAAV